MSKKIIILFIILVVSFGAAYWIYESLDTASDLLLEEPEEEESEQKEEVVKEETVTFLEKLEQETGLDFSSVELVDFVWYSEEGNKENNIKGEGFEIKDVSGNESQIIDQFLASQGFEVDDYNISAGTVTGLVGYIKGNLVCVVIGKAHLDEEGEMNEFGDIEIKCGNLVVKEENYRKVNSDDLELRVKVKDSFLIDLDANATTGYQWSADFYNSIIELESQEYIVEESAEGMVGQGGKERFKFRALSVGEIDITFSYSRFWEEGVPPIEQKIFRIIITE